MTRERMLKVVLVLVGLLFVAGIYPILTGLRGTGPGDYGDLMLLSVYAALGVFLLMAVRNPAAHRSLIGFTAWSSFAHGAVMTVLAVQHWSDHRDFLVATAVLAVIGVLLLVLLPGKQVEGARGRWLSGAAEINKTQDRGSKKLGWAPGAGSVRISTCLRQAGFLCRDP